jgi:molybdate transport system substrate-binding protein
MHFSKVLLCLLLTVAGTWLLWPTAGQSGGIHLLAGAGLRQPTDRLVDMFVQETGTEVHVSYGGAGQLMAQYLVTGEGDLFMPGAYSYIEKLQARQMIAAVEPIVLHTPVLAVNPKMVAEVTCLKDLCRPKLRVGLGDPASMALGRLAEEILVKAGLLAQVKSHVTVYAATVKQLALYVARGYVDAAIIARADAFQYENQVVMVTIPPDYYQPEIIAVGRLRSAADETAACRLQRFLSSRIARKVYADFGFLPLSPQGQ